jgi:hypothetical protein
MRTEMNCEIKQAAVKGQQFLILTIPPRAAALIKMDGRMVAAAIHEPQLVLAPTRPSLCFGSLMFDRCPSGGRERAPSTKERGCGD